MDFLASVEMFGDEVLGFSSSVDVVTVTGPDARSFLQGQITQDLAGVQIGERTLSFVLTPNGRVVSLASVHRRAPESFWLVVEIGEGESLLARLQKFKLRVKVVLELRDGSRLRLIGPSAADSVGDLDEDVSRGDLGWSACTGVELISIGPVALTWPDEGDPQLLEYLRISSGMPLASHDLDDRTLVHETPLADRTVSYTKGCFTGQELVARLDARGANVARHLRGVRIELADTGRIPESGDSLLFEGTEIGRLRSVAPTLDRMHAVAFAMAHRSIAIGTEASVIGAVNAVALSALITELPMR